MKTARNAFLVLFILSLAVLGVLTLWRPGAYPGVSAGFQPEPASWVALITSIVSLVGVATTSIISLRKERLESRKLELEMKKIQLEIDRLQNDPGMIKKSENLEESQK